MTRVRQSLTILPQILRASHHRSYDWLILKDKRIEILRAKRAQMKSALDKPLDGLILGSTVLASFRWRVAAPTEKATVL